MLYEVTLVQRYQQQVCINRWNYVSTGTPAAVQGSFALVSAMGFLPTGSPLTIPANGIFASLRALQSAALQYLEVVCKAIYDPVDFYGTGINAGFAVGTAGGDAASPALAYGFVSSRTRQDVARATKRFAGVSETLMVAGGSIDGLGLTLMGTVATRMAEVITYNDEGNILSFAPTVVKKQKYTTPKNTEAYRYYPTLAEQSTRWAQGFNWQPQNQVRTQTSRQYGSGI